MHGARAFSVGFGPRCEVLDLAQLPDFLPLLHYIGAMSVAIGRFLDDHAGAVGAVTSIFIAIFTAVLAWKTRDLNLATRGLQDFAKIQSDDMKNSVAQATRAAAAMESVSESLRDNTGLKRDIIERQKTYASMQMRAYLSPNDAGLYEGMMLDVPQPARKNVPGIVVNFRNSGHIAAYKVISWANLDVIEVAKENELIVPDLEHRSASILSPGGIMPKVLWYHRSLTDTEIAEVGAGSRAIYLYGRIEYVDCFESRRSCSFRLRYIGKFPPPKGVIFSHCQDGNHAD